MTEQKTFFNGIAAQLVGLASANEAAPQKAQNGETNSFSNGMMPQLAQLIANGESMQQNETKDFSTSEIAKLVKQSMSNEEGAQQDQTDENYEYDEDFEPYHCGSDFMRAEVILDGPIEQLCKLYSNIKSALQKSKGAREQGEGYGIYDVDFIMKEIFPEFPKNCDIADIPEIWDVKDFSFNGEYIKITSDSYFDFPENLIENVSSQYPEVKGYYLSSFSDEEFTTNDVDGKYFNQRYHLYVELINDQGLHKTIRKYFLSKDDAFNFLSSLGHGKIENDDDFRANKMQVHYSELTAIEVEGQECENYRVIVSDR